jgi:hypothetical protein
VDALCKQYRDARVDKVRVAEEAVHELKDELHRGIGKVL